MSWLRPIRLALPLLLATACATSGPAGDGAPAAAQPPTALRPSPTPVPGPVQPVPEGCLAMIFVAPGDERNVIRNARGRITEIITPSGNQEPVLARILWDELEELVPLLADIIAANDPERISHIPSFYSQGHLPGPTAWAYLRKFLRDDDAAWTFGERETGLLIIRNNQPFCLVFVQRPFADL